MDFWWWEGKAGFAWWLGEGLGSCGGWRDVVVHAVGKTCKCLLVFHVDHIFGSAEGELQIGKSRLQKRAGAAVLSDSEGRILMDSASAIVLPELRVQRGSIVWAHTS